MDIVRRTTIVTFWWFMIVSQFRAAR